MTTDFLKATETAPGDCRSWHVAMIGSGTALLAVALVAPRLYPTPHHGGLAALAAAVLLGLPLLWQTARELWRGSSQMNELAALAVLAAFAAGQYLTSAAVSLFMLAAVLIESRSARGAHKSIEALLRLNPRTARRLAPDGTEAEVEAATLAVGDRVTVRPGERIPGDGIIRSGEATLDEASVTGESLPAEKAPGDDVFAGTINLTGRLVVEIRQVGDETVLGQVKRLILAAEGAPRQPGAKDMVMQVLILIVPMFVIFYFLLIRPQRKQQKAREEMLDNLKKNDKVVTNGGIIGTVTLVRDREVKLRVDKDTELTMLRSGISKVINDSTETEQT
jgi:preprotein translocase YajC subunit